MNQWKQDKNKYYTGMQQSRSISQLNENDKSETL